MPRREPLPQEQRYASHDRVAILYPLPGSLVPYRAGWVREDDGGPKVRVSWRAEDGPKVGRNVVLYHGAEHEQLIPRERLTRPGETPQQGLMRLRLAMLAEPLTPALGRALRQVALREDSGQRAIIGTSVSDAEYRALLGRELVTATRLRGRRGDAGYRVAWLTERGRTVLAGLGTEAPSCP